MLGANVHQRVSALALASSVSYDQTLETLVNFGLAEQNRRELELKSLLEDFHTAPGGNEKDVAMNMLGEAIFGK